ncbi:MAG: 4-alpha-glucanotransferase [Thiothrix sp.]|nr:MAG: 4-alpha-glucanotransferase [Thiothrix sp.]
MTILSSRQSGVLLHITSLPGKSEQGKLDENAWRFIDWLSDAGFSVWQTLPVGPTHADHSPYLGLSAFAGNPELISISTLLKDDALSKSWLAPGLKTLNEWSLPNLKVILSSAGTQNELQSLPDGGTFLTRNRTWLQDYAQFMTIRHAQDNKPWWEWDSALQERDPESIRKVLYDHNTHYRAILLEQYLFEQQWLSLKNYAGEKGISLFGDMPLYVSLDSADVWANRRFFSLDEHGQPSVVAGVPPDMFSETGQIWGNPVYNWAALERDGFQWWVNRIRRQHHLFDLVRIDHFRALQAYWAIPGGEETAMNGEWIEAPGDPLLTQLRSSLGELPFVAEDLGYITKEVDQLREKHQLPCMRVLQFAFDGKDDNPHLPERYETNTAVYTGTHDNDTVISWFDDLHPEAQDFIRQKLGVTADEPILDAMTKTVLNSNAALAILPMQDILGLGTGNRMNMPGTIENNWLWRFSWDQLTPETTQKFKSLLSVAHRN